MKTKILSLLLFSGLILSSCDLSEKPYGKYSDSNFYRTPEDAQAALLYVYKSMTYLEYTRSIYYIGELASESCDVKNDEGFGAQEIYKWDFNTFKNNEQLTNYFKYCYIAINRANAVIDNVSNSTFNEDQKKRILGEAYFLRGFNYFGLAKMFGLVPLQRKMVATVDQTSPEMAKTMDEMYDLIIDDCHKANELLKINRVVGCADKVAAQAILAKAYLTIASSKESNVPLYRDMRRDVEIMYDSAAYWSAEVLEGQTEYAFDNDLKHIFDVEAPTGSEHIFLLSLDRSGIADGDFSSIHMMFMPWNNQNPLWFKNSDGTYTKGSYGWEVFKTRDDYAAKFENTDKRKTELMTKTYYGTQSGDSPTNNPTYLTLKYNDSKFEGVKSSVRPYIIRFSDIALVYAEAAGPTEGYPWLNKIRNRAGLSDAPAGMEKTAFRNYIIEERSLEFAFEGNRLFDLRRKAIVTTTNPRAESSGVSEETAAFYPIPQVEIDLNPNVKP